MCLHQVVIVSKIDDSKLTTKFICPDISSVAAVTQCLSTSCFQILCMKLAGKLKKKPSIHLHVVRSFCCLADDFKDAKLPPYYKTAAPPKIQKGPVYVSVPCANDRVQVPRL